MVIFLFLIAIEIPDEVAWFKRTQPSTFLHKKTHVEIEVLTPDKINMSQELAEKLLKLLLNTLMFVLLLEQV
jgi:hypothetical protein